MAGSVVTGTLLDNFAATSIRWPSIGKLLFVSRTISGSDAVSGKQRMQEGSGAGDGI